MAPLLAALAQAGLPLLFNVLKAKGKEVVEEKFGVDIEELSRTEAGLIRLKELEMENEQFLLLHAERSAEQDIRRQELEDKDRDSARDMNAKIQEAAAASWMAKNAAYYLDFVIVGAVIALALALFLAEIPSGNKELAYTIFGSLMTLAVTVINFHRGSSRNNQNKDATIDRLSRSDK